MAAAKKGKKTSKPKKGSKTKKSGKKSNMNFFSKTMLLLLLLAALAGATLLIIKNFNLNNIKNRNKNNTEIYVKKETDTKKTSDNKTGTDIKKTENKAKAEVKKENKAKTNTAENKSKEKVSEKNTKILEGLWHSSEQGAYITFDEYGYRIDFSNVHASKPITGNYTIENNTITFTSDSDECNGVEGSYRINFYKKDISLICKKDECVKRKGILEADWEWLEY